VDLEEIEAERGGPLGLKSVPAAVVSVYTSGSPLEIIVRVKIRRAENLPESI
jgi:hypothetical protein